MVHAGLVPYQEAWDEQRRVHAAVAAGTAPDTVLLLEHPAVYTAGKRTSPFERPQDGTPVIDVDRGGKITWHGPGQLVGYPIVALPDPVDVVAHVDRKVAAIGIRVSQGVTMHGFALNCDADLTAYDRIVPCGLTDATVTSLTKETGRVVTVADVTPYVEKRLTEVLRAG